MVATLEDEFVAAPDVPGVDPSSPSTWWPAIALDSLRKGQPWRKVPDMPLAVSMGAPLDAYVNDGRWVVDCPECPSAQNVSPADPRFWCPTCESGGVWHKIRFPRNRAAIEEQLDVRPSKSNRHWLPHETVADLKRENREHEVDL